MTAFAGDSLARPTVVAVEENLDTTQTFKQGQFVKRVSVGANLQLQPATADSDGPDVRGVAVFTFPQESEPAGPEAPASAQTPATIALSGIHMFKGRAGQAFDVGLPVVIDEVAADGQTVRLQGGNAFTDVVGEVAAVASETGAGNQGVDGDGNSFNVPVWIAPPDLGRNNGTSLVLV